MIQTANRRLLFLDSSRGLAALIVLLSHFQLTIFPQLNNSWLLKTPFHLIMDGTSAILYFFILSGFVLTLSIRSNGKISIGNYVKFIILRIFRIFPAFIFTLLITYVTIHSLDPGRTTWLSQYWNTQQDFHSLINQALLIVRLPNDPLLRLIPHDWTLSIEIVLSMFLPFLVYAFRKKSIYFLIVIYLLVQFFKIDPFIFDFSLGIFMACNLETLKNRWSRNKYKIYLLSFAFLLISADFAFPDLMKATDIVLIHHKSWGLAILLWVIISSTNVQRVLSFKPMIFLGKISYSLYLLHLIILFISVKFFTLNAATFLLVYLTFTVVISSITYYLIEKPFNKIGKYIVSKG